MKERPILFSAPMIRAQRAGIKTQTRRLVKPQPKTRPGMNCTRLVMLDRSGCEVIDTPVGDKLHLETALCPYGQPGDRLRVKEAAWMWCERIPNGRTKTGRDKWRYVPLRGAPIHYAADHPAKPSVDVVSPGTGNKWGWRLKIGRFLPAWASRTTLEITGVRIERLQDISDQDAIAEGIPRHGDGFGRWHPDPDDIDHTGTTKKPVLSYMGLWESINGAGSWAANPWVWVVEFKDASKGGAA